MRWLLLVADTYFSAQESDEEEDSQYDDDDAKLMMPAAAAAAAVSCEMHERVVVGAKRGLDRSGDGDRDGDRDGGNAGGETGDEKTADKSQMKTKRQRVTFKESVEESVGEPVCEPACEPMKPVVATPELKDNKDNSVAAAPVGLSIFGASAAVNPDVVVHDGKGLDKGLDWKTYGMTWHVWDYYGTVAMDCSPTNVENFVSVIRDAPGEDLMNRDHPTNEFGSILNELRSLSDQKNSIPTDVQVVIYTTLLGRSEIEGTAYDLVGEISKDVALNRPIPVVGGYKDDFGLEGSLSTAYAKFRFYQRAFSSFIVSLSLSGAAMNCEAMDEINWSTTPFGLPPLRDLVLKYCGPRLAPSDIARAEKEIQYDAATQIQQNDRFTANLLALQEKRHPMSSPTSPSYNPTSPSYNPTSPSYVPVSPSYNPTTPTYGEEKEEPSVPTVTTAAADLVPASAADSALRPAVLRSAAAAVYVGADPAACDVGDGDNSHNNNNTNVDEEDL